MGYVDIKHTVWIRMYVGDDDVAEFLKDPSSASADNLSDKAEEIEWLDETSERVEPVDNSDTATVEVYEGSGKLVWNNVDPATKRNKKLEKLKQEK
jgi:hypothetical protein